jgi:AraC family transcriptional regulator of adaptative response/methylated-DNA-[protein]-cysteine methyltransferase
MMRGDGRARGQARHFQEGKNRRKNRVGETAEACDNARMNDYERVARVIRHLDGHHREQPDLAALAAGAGLSAFHFHRLFAKWAGVTPKDFLQCLTAAQVKAALRRGESALGAALDAGLSGPGRLHDLCVMLEGASPGEIKSGGAGWKLEAGFAESPFGKCLIAQGARGICFLAFVPSYAKASEGKVWAELKKEWPRAEIKRNDTAVKALAAKIFARRSERRVPLRALVGGTPFQARVWRALVQVPEGTLVTYGDIAKYIGRPSASRAVGSAVGANPISYLIPCHRVIRETGVIGQYRWGTGTKRALVGWETARAG